MKRRTAAFAVAGAICLFAQSSREDYRAAYRTWREAEPTLELDAPTAGEALAARASRAAADQAKYGAAHSAFLRQLAGGYSPSVLSLQTAFPPIPPGPAPAPQFLRLITAETSSLNINISALAKDSDPVIRPLQQALDRERSALAALNSAIEDRQKAEDKATQTVTVMEQDRSNAAQQYQNVLASIGASADSVDRETAAWAAYYQKLAEGARAVAPSAAPPAAAPVLSSTLNPTAPPLRTAPITPLPLARYTGAWNYSTAGGMFHGAEPEFVDLTVRAENGKATGTFYARFKLPPGSTGDPLVRFDFSGDLRPTRIQTFPLETSDGAKGSVELIPGNAFNLLEVNFEMEIRPGKLHLGDVLLVKK